MPAISNPDRIPERIVADPPHESGPQRIAHDIAPSLVRRFIRAKARS